MRPVQGGPADTVPQKTLSARLPAAAAKEPRAFAAHGRCRWQCIVGNLKKWKDGPLQIAFGLGGRTYRLEATRTGDGGGHQIVEFVWDAPLAFGQLLEELGRIPIPPYLCRESEELDNSRYQTVYSRFEGSVAAPTAGLHFTPEVIGRLRAEGHPTAEVTLHVGAGTFLPVKAGNAAEHPMHTEHFEITLDALQGILEHIDRITAVGTTSMRTLESLAALPDPTGAVLEERTLYNDLKLTRVSVPLGVVAMVYEARPNVTVDAAGICVKSGNACVLRSGSLAIHSAVALGEVLQGALSQVGLPKDCVVVIDSTDRSVTDEFFLLRDLVDVLIPRGGAGLIRHCVEHSLIPVIETGTGNCHIYIHESADLAKAYPIVLNAKTQRVGVCNACESVLVDRSIARACLPELLRQLAAAKVRIHGDEVVGELDIPVEAATEEDWGTEYLDYEISIKCVEGLEEAIAHINRFGTKHSEAILAEDEAAAHTFARRVDAAAVYINASTRFTDGGEFGLGAEIGISTQKLHVRGPFALEALTTYKYIIEGEGQVRA